MFQLSREREISEIVLSNSNETRKYYFSAKNKEKIKSLIKFEIIEKRTEREQCCIYLYIW